MVTNVSSGAVLLGPIRARKGYCIVCTVNTNDSDKCHEAEAYRSTRNLAEAHLRLEPKPASCLVIIAWMNGLFPAEAAAISGVFCRECLAFRTAAEASTTMASTSSWHSENLGDDVIDYCTVLY